MPINMANSTSSLQMKCSCKRQFGSEVGRLINMHRRRCECPVRVSRAAGSPALDGGLGAFSGRDPKMCSLVARVEGGRGRSRLALAFAYTAMLCAVLLTRIIHALAAKTTIRSLYQCL